MTFFRTVGHQALPTASLIPSAQGSAHKLSSAKPLVTMLMQNKRWKGEPQFLEGEAEETGDVWWEDEQ